MTKEEILARQSSKEFDIMIHLKFFPGTTILWDEGYYRYSSDMNAAWVLAQKIPLWRIEFVFLSDTSVRVSYRSPFSEGDVLARTAPEAICKAALLSLLAVMEGKDEE